METIIKIHLNEEGSIIIEADKDVKHVISQSNKKISAQEIYEILQYEEGKKYKLDYKLDEENERGALGFFVELMENIVFEVNSIGDSISIESEADVSVLYSRDEEELPFQ